MRRILAVAMALLLASCARAEVREDDDDFDPSGEVRAAAAPLRPAGREVDLPGTDFEREVRFEVESWNFAWGYHHSGFVIDADGVVFTFSDETKGVDDPGTGKYGEVTRSGHVSAKSLSKGIALAEKAAAGHLVKIRDPIPDAGSRSATAYVPGSSPGKRLQVPLGTMSHGTHSNDSPAAELLREWLKSIDDDIQEKRRAARSEKE